MRGRNGVIYPAGLRVRPRNQVKLDHHLGGLYRAVVINTYTPDEDQNPTDYQVFCDVVLLKTQTPLPMVPVAMPYGLNNGGGWIPKPTTKTLSGLPLNLTLFSRKGVFQGETTSYEDMDGDMVLIQFAEGSRQFPLIVGKFTHQNTKRTAVDGSGWSDGPLQDEQRGHPEKKEAYFRHGGTEVRVNEAGDLLVDTVGATDDDLTEAPLPTSGDVRVRLKRGRKLIVVGGSVGGLGGLGGDDLLTLTQDELGNATAEVAVGQVKVTVPVAGPALLDLLGATQPFVRGLDLQTALTNLTTALNTYAAAIQTIADPSTTATTALTAAIAAFQVQLAATLSLTIKGE